MWFTKDVRVSWKDAQGDRGPGEECPGTGELVSTHKMERGAIARVP